MQPCLSRAASGALKTAGQDAGNCDLVTIRFFKNRHLVTLFCAAGKSPWGDRSNALDDKGVA